MRWLLFAVPLALPTMAAAQTVTPRSVATVYGLDFATPAIDTGRPYRDDLLFPYYDREITPTMRRQREERARMAIAAFPELEAELATASPYQARQILLAAEKKARWQRIRARDALHVHNPN